MSPTPSLARTFFDSILNAPDSVAFLRGLKASPIPTDELDWRDFKADPAADNRRKDLWSKALGGFANNQGGTLVWGLDARKVSDVDRVCDEKPVDNPEAFKTRLVELHRDAVDPPLPNVEYLVYPLPEDAQKGFVVCFIPEGPHKPYRAMHCTGQPFYIRVGDSFKLMPMSVLRSLFYPRSEAVFEVSARVHYEIQDKRDDTSIPSALFTCDTRVRNAGNATAKDIYMIVRSNVPAERSHNMGRKPFWAKETSTEGGASFTAHRPLHPEMETQLYTLTWNTRTGFEYSGSDSKDVPRGPDWYFEFAIFAEGQQPQGARLDFSLAELIAKNGGAVEQRVKATPIS